MEIILTKVKEKLIAMSRSRDLAVFVFYCLAAVLLTMPVILHLGRAIPGDGGDAFLFVWNQWWLKYSIASLHNPYFTDMIAYPFVNNLAFSTFVLINNAVSALFQTILPLVVSFNLVFLLSLAVASYFTYRLVYLLTENRTVSVFAGIAFVYTSYVYGEMHGHFNYTSIYIIPLFVLLLVKIYRDGKLGYGLWAGLALAASFYNDIYYTIGLMTIAFIFVAYLVLRDRNLFLSRIKSLTVFAVTWAIVSAPLLWYTLGGYFSGQYTPPTVGQINYYSPDIRSLLTPSRFHTVYGSSYYNYFDSLRWHGTLIYLGFTVLFLAILGYVAVRKEKDFSKSAKPWVFLGVCFLLLALGPLLYFDGYIFSIQGQMITFPLPFLAFHMIPFFNGMLVAPRLIIFASLSLTILAAYGLKSILTRIKSGTIRTSLAVLAGAIVIFENIAVPLPMKDATVPDFYRQLAADNEDYTLLDLPFGMSTSYYTLGNLEVSSELMYYQSVHHKKIMEGWIARIPDDRPSFYQRLVGLDFLMDPNVKLSAEQINNMKDKFLSNLAKLNVRYIIVHPEYYNHSQLRNTVGFLDGAFAAKPAMADGMLIYKLK